MMNGCVVINIITDSCGYWMAGSFKVENILKDFPPCFVKFGSWKPTVWLTQKSTGMINWHVEVILLQINIVFSVLLCIHTSRHLVLTVSVLFIKNQMGISDLFYISGFPGKRSWLAHLECSKFHQTFQYFIWPNLLRGFPTLMPGVHLAARVN